MTQKIKPYGLSILIHLTFGALLLFITSMELTKTQSIIELDLSLFETETVLRPHEVSPAVISQEPVLSQTTEKDHFQKEIGEMPEPIAQTTPLNTHTQEIQKKEEKPIEHPKIHQVQEGLDTQKDKKEQPQTYAENKPHETSKTQDHSHQTEEKIHKVPSKEQVGQQVIQSGAETKPVSQQGKSAEAKQEVLSTQTRVKKETEQTVMLEEMKRNLYLKEKLSVISSLVQKNIHYPSIARRMGWEGRVMLAIHIGEDGSLRDVKVIESSGYDVLDRNAVETVRRIANLFPRPPVDVIVKLPVSYKLE
ncbi:MAG: energy transducer TonB [Aquificaceae bacterium]|nr:energy transducer TonB [Aquificaceae bacterium]MCX8077002.1 energy transducer TonB [Aquificaceae bacterium]